MRNAALMLTCTTMTLLVLLDRNWKVPGISCSSVSSVLSQRVSMLLTREFLASTIRVSAEELAATGETSIALSDESGYIATLGVYHELHCLVNYGSSFLV